MTETNNRVTVTCAADSLLICISNIACTEPPSVEWNFCGKTIIGGGERVQMDVIHEGGKTNYEVILRINKVTDQDFGEYTCILRNRSVQIKKKIRITQQFMQQITGESEPSKDVVNVKKIKNLLEKDVHGLQEQGEGAKTEKKLKKIKGKLSVTKKQQRGNGTDMAAQKTDIIVPAVDTDKELSASDGTMIANPDFLNESVLLSSTVSSITNCVQILPESLQTNQSNGREPENFQLPPTQTHRLRRMSTIDLSRSGQRPSRMASWSLHLPGADSLKTPLIDQVYSNPEMEIFRQRRLSQQMTRRRNSLAELIPDWPTLDYIEKPEYRMPEFKEDVPGEAQTLELRKMDPTAIFKANYWIEDLQEITCQEKESKVEFICRYSEQNVRPQWFKNTSEIFHGHKYNFINDDGLFRLVIQRITKEDSGKYTCQADDKQTSAYLNVREKKIEYLFTKKLPARSTVKEKQNLILECILSDPRPMVIWSKNEETIEYTPEMFEISRRENRCILKMKNVKQDLDGAEFSCEVNGDKTVCRVNVTEPEYQFVRHLNDVDSYENETAVFECEMNYDDVPDLQWIHIDSVLNMRGSKFQYLKDGFKHQLKVLNVSLQDEGLYSCTIQNKVSIAKLYVAPDVVIVERLKDLKKVESDSVKLQCEINNPRDYLVEWFKDGLPMAASDNRVEIVNKDGRVQILHIKSLSLSDSGVYMCKIGERQTSARLEVDECCKPPSVNIDFVPREIKVKAGRSIEVDIPYTGTPIPVTKWLKNGKPLSSESGVYLSQSLDSCCIRIATVTRSDSGEYELVLSNESGIEQVPITFIVEDKPLEPEGPLQVMDVFKDRCHLSWEPPKDDGNLGIDYYLVEAQDIDNTSWIVVGLVQGDTQCGIPNLDVGKKYMFRVKAINAAGESQPLISQKEVLAKDPWDPPSRPGRPEIADYDRNQAEIHWKPSLDNGGSPIQKYVIEKRQTSEPWETAGMVHPRDTYAIIPDLLEGKDYEFRVCAVNEAGRGEFSFTSPALHTKATRVPPKIDHSSLMPAVKLKTGQDLVLDVKYSGEPEPVVNWTKANQEMCAAENVTNILCGSKLVIKKAQPTDSSRYQITVRNKYGTDSVQIDVFVIGVPSSPTGPLMATDIRKNSAVLHWKPPENNGGRPIMNYIIEKMNTSTGLWERASSCVPYNATHFKVTKLVEGVCYMFRITAENDQGLSQPLVSETETKAETPFTVPDPPRNPVVTVNDINHVCIKWEEPSHDGGSPVTSYHVERKEQSITTWTRLNECLISATEFSDDKVRSNRQYEYRIIAENEAGESQHSGTSIPVTVKSAEEKPFLDAMWIKDIVVKVNQDFTFLGLMRGCPTPTVIWYHNGQKIDNSEHCQIKTTEDSVSLRINKAVKSDAGQYTVRLTNSGGSIQTNATVSIVGPPGQPLGPLEAVDTSPDSITLTWNLPKDDGGLPIERFVLEKRQDGSKKWQKVASNIGFKETKVMARNLTRGCDYDFRLVAVNEMGDSDPLRTSAPIKAEFPFKPPSKPGVVDCTGKTDNSITLSWTAPTDDGGSSILGYVIQKREGSNSWTRAYTGEIIGTELTVGNLCENKEYEFRIAAINDAGPGEYAVTPSSIKLLSTSDVPDAPRFLKAEMVFNGDILLNWKPPIYSGGSCITQYIIEMLLQSSSRDWTCWACTRFTQLTIFQLPADENCEFRIKAENIFGQSIPCRPVVIQTNTAKENGKTILPEKPIRSECSRSRSVEPMSTITRRKLVDDKRKTQEVSESIPSFSFPLRDRNIQEGNGVKLIACVDGLPQPKIQWLKDGEKLTNNEKYMIADSFGVCSLEICCCRLKDTGKYACKATNVKGSIETSCHITVEISSPNFTAFACVTKVQPAASARNYKMLPMQYLRKPRKSIVW